MNSKYSNNHRSFPIILLDSSSGRNVNVSGILEQASKFGWKLINLSLTEGILPYEYNLAGAIIGKPADYPRSAFICGLNCPTVRIGHLPHPMDEQIPAVISDSKKIGKLAADHFIERNFHHLCYIGHRPWSDAHATYESFKQRAEEKNCECHLFQFNSINPKTDLNERYKDRRIMFTEWISRIPKPIGLFAYNDSLAAKLIAYCFAENIAVPEEVAVLGSGNFKHQCETAIVPISSVDQGIYNRGKEAAIILHKLINGETLPKSPLLIPPTGIVLRQSTDLLAVSDPIVAKAIRFIWDNLREQISIDEIAKSLGVSRSILDHAFNLHLGRSPNRERLRKRLECCCEMLLNSNRTIADIACSAGFPSVNYLHQKFKSEFRVTPRQFRINHRTKQE